MIFGGYSLYLQKMGILDVAGILESQGQSAAVAAILQTLPLPKLIMIAVCVLCFIYLATTIDSCAYVLAGTTTKSIGRKEEPARWNRICWALIFCALSVGLMIIGGLQAIQSVSIIAACRFFPVMAEGYACHIYPWLSAALSAIASVFPFSLEEVLVVI